MTNKREKPRKNVVKIFRDVRIFVNTVNKAIHTMIEAGIPAESNKTETDDYIEFYVKIPKNAQNEQQNSVICIIQYQRIIFNIKEECFT